MANPNRKQVEEKIYKFFDIMDKTGLNTKKYKAKFSKMTDDQFHKYMINFLKDDDANFYYEIKAFENEPSLQDIKKASDFLKVPLEEYVYMPYINGDNQNPIRSVTKCPTGYLHLKRLQQMLHKKNASSIDIEIRSQKSGYTWLPNYLGKAC